MPVDPVGHAWAKTLDPPVIFREPDGLFTEDGGGIEIQEQAVR